MTATDVTCPACGARESYRCRSKRTGNPVPLHFERMALARELERQAVMTAQTRAWSNIIRAALGGHG